MYMPVRTLYLGSVWSCAVQSFHIFQIMRYKILLLETWGTVA